MNRPSAIMKTGTEPVFQIILIASALMHILAIALISHPYMQREKIDDKYFVKLVTPVKVVQKQKQKPKTIKIKKTKPVVSVKPEKKSKPLKKVQKPKPAKKIIKTIKSKSIKKRYKADKKLSKSELPLAKSNKSLNNNAVIKRKDPQHRKEQDRSFSLKKTRGGPAFMAKADTKRNIGMITAKEVAQKKEHKNIEKGVRDQSFNRTGNHIDDQHMIARSDRNVEADNVPLENATRDSIYEEEEREIVDGSQYAIARSHEPVTDESENDLSEEDVVEYPGTDFTGDNGLSQMAGDADVPSIERRVSAASPQRRKISDDLEKEQFMENTEIADEKNVKEEINTSQLMIKGIPLDELHVCSNALDERTLKKKILNVIGDNMGCYRKGVGEFMFMGTSRFASFDMKILPHAGRKLSNRCEELKHALNCLTFERNEL